MPRYDLTERILRLRQIPVLSRLSSRDLAPLAASLRARVFEKGDQLLRADEAPRSFFLLTTGTVAMSRQGRRFGTIRGPGGVGLIPVLARGQGVDAVAESFVDALEARAEALDEVF